MQYHFEDGVAPDKKRVPKIVRFILLLVGVFLIGGLYAGATYLAPSLAAIPIIGDTNPEETKQKLLDDAPGKNGNRLYIPQLNVNLAIVAGKNGTFVKDAWQRQPESGNPLEGGNFALGAQKFAWGFTPHETRVLSPFYNLDKLQINEQIYVDYKNKRYVYKITRQYTAEKLATDLEGPSTDSKLTLYVADNPDEAMLRAVIEAKQIGIVANGRIELNTDLMQ